MNTLAVAIFFVAVAYANAGGLDLGLIGGHGISAKGAVEGALGGQWVPDVPNVASGATAKGVLEGELGGQWIPDVPVGHAAPLGIGALGLGVGAPGLGLGIGGLGIGGLGIGGLGIGGVGLGGVGLGARGLGLGLGVAGHGVSRGSLEGALGGKWIPDTHGK